MNLREKFCSFFERHDHLIIGSASVIPHEDNSLLLINSGMAPLKDYFLGYKKSPYKNLVDIQKCIRAGGKHNDLDEVGYTKRHHTFFEMCGNFSFGGYSHKEAINLAWKFLTEDLKINPDKLYVTVHPEDSKSLEVWKEIVPTHRIISLKENEWSMGSDGPCGMCTEIFYDHGEHLQGTVEDGDRFVEIWNIVLMTHQVHDGIKTQLDRMCIDTGMGLERVEAVLNGVDDNYEIPFFKEVIDKMCQISSTTLSPSHKIIADHARAVVFIISDGVLPELSGRGYVLRRIMRRAIRHEVKLNCNDLLKTSVNYTIDKMGAVYPEIIRNRKLIEDIVDAECKQFREVFRNGIENLNKLTKDCGQLVSGDIIFKLYDTYGLPTDIITDVLREKNLTPNLDEFETILESNKDRSRGNNPFKAQEKSTSQTEFVGYEQSKIEAKVVEISNNNEHFGIILDKTPFYAESGGQESDHGLISGDGWEMHVTHVEKSGDAILHYGAVSGNPERGNSCIASIDEQRRLRLMQHHSATHLLLLALRKYVGNDVIQKGSCVKEDGLRFDFLCNRSIEDLILKIEKQVNEWIQENKSTHVESMSKEDSEKMSAVATFGEKYGDTVRVVKVGDSIELCGGTHVDKAGDIGSFYITKERSISANVRRINAVAGMSAYEYAKGNIGTIDSLSKELKVPKDNLKTFILNLQKGPKQKENHTVDIFKDNTSGIDFTCLFYDNASQSILLKATDDLIKENDVVLVVNYTDNKSSCSLKTRSVLDAKAILREILDGANVGGRPDFAHGGVVGKVDRQGVIDRIKKVLDLHKRNSNG